MPGRLARFVLVLAQHEAFRHHQALAGRLDNLAQNIEIRTSVGEASYLFLHGLAKVIFISAIFLDKKWGYTCLIVVMSIFSALEVGQAIRAHEIFTGAFGLFDLVLVALIYKELKTRFPKESTTEASSLIAN